MKIKNTALLSVLGLLATLALPASAVQTYTRETLGQFTVSATSTATWTLNLNQKMSFSLDRAVPVTISIAVSATTSAGVVDLSNYDCKFLAGGLNFVSTEMGLTIAKAAGSSAQSIICDIGTTANFMTTATTFRIGPATNMNASGQFGELQIAFESQSSGGGSGTTAPSTKAAKYDGPEILELPRLSGHEAGSQIAFKGKKLETVTAATIDGKDAKLSYSETTGLTIETPADLKPGTYDLVLQSAYGKLTHIDAIKISAPVELISMSLRGSGSKIDARLATDLSNLSLMFGSDFKRVTCVVNASDAATAEALAAHVCKYVKSGDLRSASVVAKAKTSFKGEGFWVRVYLAG